MAIVESRATPSRPNKWVALTVVCLIVFVICINTTAINTAVATIADDLSLSTSTLGWALDVYMVAMLDEHLDRAGAGQVEKAKLDRVLTGSPSALKSTAKELDPNTRKAFVSGARRGIVGGFSDVMWLIAAVGIAGTVVGFWLLGPDRQRPRP